MDIKTLKLEKFNEVGSKFSRKISITNAGSFGFPPTFISENKINDPQYATVFYDEAQNVIGIQFIGSEKMAGSSFKLSFNKTVGGASFGARSFFNSHKILPNDIKDRYDYKKNNIEGIGEVYLIDLNAGESKSNNQKL